MQKTCVGDGCASSDGGIERTKVPLVMLGHPSVIKNIRLSGIKRIGSVVLSGENELCGHFGITPYQHYPVGLAAARGVFSFHKYASLKHHFSATAGDGLTGDERTGR